MRCGSITNSANEQEIVTLDREGICWVKLHRKKQA